MSNTCVTYLKTLQKLSVPLGSFFLERGRTFAANRLPTGVALGPPKRCYQNAASAVLYSPDSDWLYVEGFACLPGLFPMQHAWCIDRSGTVIDLTWSYQPGIEYFGVVFDTDALRDIVLETQVWGVFAEHIPENFVLNCNYIHAAYR